MNPIYTTSATVSGGRDGRASTPDGRLDIKLDMPKELGGSDGPGTDPEQLFAAGYAACFESAVRACARGGDVMFSDLSITAEVSLLTDGAGKFGLAVALTGSSDDLAEEQLAALMREAHDVCPYSHATRGNITVTLAPA
ncbi:unannotated protein [freshwater metagenome]|uniref:Unannotated protein n=1 Tax=freshwater metagenome TaxID=449393 RepID=A0A6J7CTQ6_9ZZZZ|nr:Ohr family peroxiredoxin [Actinomycetota bacterium]